MQTHSVDKFIDLRESALKKTQNVLKFMEWNGKSSNSEYAFAIIN